MNTSLWSYRSAQSAVTVNVIDAPVGFLAVTVHVSASLGPFSRTARLLVDDEVYPPPVTLSPVRQSTLIVAVAPAAIIVSLLVSVNIFLTLGK